MDTLTAEDVTRRLAEWWRVINNPARPGQQVVHVNRLHRPDTFFVELAAFRVWKEHSSDSVALALRQLIKDSADWSYIPNATQAYGIGVANTRIVIAPQHVLADSDSYQRYWVEVHGPYFATACHESVLLLTEDQVVRAGVELLEYDVNLWGVNGIMRTYYSSDGDETERCFIPWSEYIAGPEGDYILRVRRLAHLVGRKLRPAVLTT